MRPGRSRPGKVESECSERYLARGFNEAGALAPRTGGDEASIQRVIDQLQ